ncbi:hypothetical protein AXG93_1219s1060 [Marchantia polymorpha subsp. ruderalis]|uniref:Uncharacterized protein n=1 Tax=Marchantia polymorpha subsp. ruderalis TaxID=1480154 RepID=A0A176VI09_MARPO|nr:hypothetical protein AXG93_1219s1060 [Marchantia polymorpha subsp. ruderalis]
MKGFLDARVEELISGCLLLCNFGATADDTGPLVDGWLTPLSEDKPHRRVSIMRLLEQGLVTEEQRALCNIAWYMYTNKEVEELLKSYEGDLKADHRESQVSNIFICIQLTCFGPTDRVKSVETYFSPHPKIGLH